MNKRPAAAALRDEDDIEWMEQTYPLHEAWIQAAIDKFCASNQQAQARRAGPGFARPRASDSQSGALYARVSGPVDGYYIASHACRASDTESKGYLGTYKICDVAPASYWTAQSLQFGTCKHTESTGMGALASAESAAARKIADMPIRVDRP